MKLAKFSILVAAAWCTYCLCVSLIAGAVVIFCTSPDIPQCGTAGFEVATRWKALAPISIVLFGAGAIFAFRSIAPDICKAYRAIASAIAAARARRP
jgi:hypothetical protein